MKIRISEIGEVDTANLWSVFQTDAQGKTGLFAGQLLRELNEKAPELRPQLFDLVRRGLASDDPRERIAALHGALQLPSTELGPELEQLATQHRDWLAQAQSPAGASVVSLFFELLEREPQGSESALRAFDLARVSTNPPVAQSRALARLDPQRAVDALFLALDSGSDEAVELTKQLSFTSRFDDVVRELATRSPELRSRFVQITYRALGADQFPAAYDRWWTLAGSLKSVPQQPPARPVASEASLRFAEMLKKMNQEEAAAPAPPPFKGPVVLSAEVWADGIRMPEGPPAQLFSRLIEKSITVLTSDALIGDIKQRLSQLGWPDPMVTEAEARVRQQSTVKPAKDEAELARAAGLDSVYTVGPRTGTVDAGVTFRPVHELLSRLQA